MNSLNFMQLTLERERGMTFTSSEWPERFARFAGDAFTLTIGGRSRPITRTPHHFQNEIFDSRVRFGRLFLVIDMSSADERVDKGFSKGAHTFHIHHMTGRTRPSGDLFPSRARSPRAGFEFKRGETKEGNDLVHTDSSLS
jgi:hypothetical protein